MIQYMELFTNAGFALGAFLVCLLGFPVTIRLSKAVGLVDTPNTRKQHSRATPLVGGITVYLAFFLVSSILAQEWINLSMVAWIGAVVAIGVYDDYADLSALHRIAAHSAIIVGIFFTDGLLVYSIGDVLGNGPIQFVTTTALCLTIVAVIGAVNAVNMIDGVDGLLGSLAVVSLFALLTIAITTPTSNFTNQSFSVTDISAMLGALCAFLLFNCRFFRLSQAIVFMGDAGSTAIGFCLVYLLIDYSQGSNALISPVTAGWILGLPLLDASAVIGKRIISGKSPIKPGRDHIHHLLIDSGISVNKAVGILVLAHCLMVLMGVSAKIFLGHHADFVLFWSFVGLVVFKIAYHERIALLILKSAAKINN